MDMAHGADGAAEEVERAEEEAEEADEVSFRSPAGSLRSGARAAGRYRLHSCWPDAPFVVPLPPFAFSPLFPPSLPYFFRFYPLSLFCRSVTSELILDPIRPQKLRSFDFI